MAVPPHTDVPEANKKESLWETPNNLPMNITIPKDKRTKVEIHKKYSEFVSNTLPKLKLPPKKTMPVCKIFEPNFFV